MTPPTTRRTRTIAAAVVENWFVDYYWNAKEYPFSGHSDMLTEMAANVDPATMEVWPQYIIDGTNHMHFDSSQPGFPDLSNPQGVDEEWQRLMRVTRSALAEAKAAQDPLTVMALVGMSLHTVQDFYAHTSWVETSGELGSPDGPGWSQAYGSFPTYFDIPKSARDSGAVYSGVNASIRGQDFDSTITIASASRGRTARSAGSARCPPTGARARRCRRSRCR